MKCNQDLFETLFQTAQKPLVMECSQALEAIRFSLPIDWTVQQQSGSLLYLLPSEGESSLSVQSVIPESTDITDFERVSVLHAFADGMREQLEITPIRNFVTMRAFSMQNSRFMECGIRLPSMM